MTSFSAPSIFFLLLIAACDDKQLAPPLAPVASFDSIPVAKPLTPPLSEISGIAASRTMPGHVWGHEDSGNPPVLYRIDTAGRITNTTIINGATNRDWEDMARAGTDLYIGDIGDNDRQYSEYTIYKVSEPDSTMKTTVVSQKIIFRYPDGAHDAEALLVDEATKDIFIITKRDALSRLYKISFPYATTLNDAVFLGTLPYSGVVSATQSADGKELIVKTYNNLYHYHRNNKPMAEALQGTPTMLPYKMEPQGEAVSFAADDSGYFTLSEKGMSNTVNLYFYKRK